MIRSEVRTLHSVVLALSGLCWTALGGCSEAHVGPHTGTETGNPPLAGASLNEARVALVVTADQVRVTGSPGAAAPADSQVEIVSALTGQVFRGNVAADGSFDVAVSGSALDTYRVRVVSGEQTSSAVYVAPGAAAVTSGKGDALTCKQREELAHAQLEAVAAKADARCRIDSDCTLISSNSACNDSCSQYATSALGAQTVADAARAVEAGLCKTYASDGCSFVALPCAPPLGEPVCVGGLTCALVNRSGPECIQQTVCVDGLNQPWGNVCIHSVSEVPSASLNDVCVVDDQGKLGLTWLRGDQAITNKGWSWSKYGLFPSSLSPADETRCSAAKASFGEAFRMNKCADTVP